MTPEERVKLIADLEKELGNITDHHEELGISCRLHVAENCLPAFLEMVKAINKIERK